MSSSHTGGKYCKTEHDEQVTLQIPKSTELFLIRDKKFLKSSYCILLVINVIFSSIVVGFLGSSLRVGIHFVYYPFTIFHQLLMFSAVCTMMTSVFIIFMFSTSLTQTVQINWKLLVLIVFLTCAAVNFVFSLFLLVYASHYLYMVFGYPPLKQTLIAGILAFFLTISNIVVVTQSRTRKDGRNDQQDTNPTSSSGRSSYDATTVASL